MMGERERDAVAEFLERHAIARGEHDGALAFVPERVGIEFSELADQAALAMEVGGVAVSSFNRSMRTVVPLPVASVR